MGTTLATIHAYKQKLQAVQDILPSACVRQISEDWTSVLDIEPGDSEKLARKLSKALEAPAMAFNCFDDDLISLKLYSQGKLSAQYIMNEGYEPYLKHCDQFVSVLGWDNKLISRLRKIFKCDDLSRKIDMLEEFFGVAFYVHSEFISEGAQAYVKQRGDSLYKAYEIEQKKINRIKNQTTVVLTQEINAKGMPVMNRRDYFLLAGRKGDTYDGSECGVYKLDKDQLLPVMGNLRIPHPYICLYPFKSGYNIYNPSEKLPHTKHQKVCLQVSLNGTVFDEIALPDNVSQISVSLEDGSLLYLYGGYFYEIPPSMHRLTKNGIRWSRIFD